MAYPVTKETAQEPTKDFYIRGVPETLHRRWKTMAAFTGKGMSGLAVLSIDAYVSALERKLPQFHMEEEDGD